MSNTSMVADAELLSTDEYIQMADHDIVVDHALTHVDDRDADPNALADGVPKKTPVSRTLNRGWAKSYDPFNE